ncbi:MAG: serine hydrolase [Planctomycetaceae bacterium]
MWERKRGQMTPADWHLSNYCTRPSPGSSFRGPIRELGQFYEALLAVLDGRRDDLLSRNTLQIMTSRQREGLVDRTFLHTVDFGFGVIIDSNRYGAETVPYGYGRYCSPRTFGHGGSQSSQGYCDPECGLVVAYQFNGRPGEPQHQRRVKSLNEAIYQDLALASQL